MGLSIIDATIDCHPVTEALARTGDKWTILIVMQLETGPKRFSALRRSVNGISQKMLALTCVDWSATGTSRALSILPNRRASNMR